MTDGTCDICTRHVDDIEQYYCYGCGWTICDRHRALYGTHDPVDHAFEEGELEAMCAYN